MAHSSVAYILLAQVSVVSGIEIYLDPLDNKPPKNLIKSGAKFTSAFTDKAAFMYRSEGSKHYLKFVGPKSPKGGGFYLSPKLPLKDFLIWLDAFAKGFLGREIALKLGANIEPPYTVIEKLNFIEEHGPIPDLNKKFHTPLQEWGPPALLEGAANSGAALTKKKAKKATF